MTTIGRTGDSLSTLRLGDARRDEFNILPAPQCYEE
jgi:hypothetical protein